MNRIILLLILIGIGIYIYFLVFKSDKYENIRNTNYHKRHNNYNEKHTNYDERQNRHVHFAPHDHVFEQKIQKIESFDEEKEYQLSISCDQQHCRMIYQSVLRREL